MRILITFKPERNYYLLPVNYNYEVSSMIYHIMSLSGKNFTRWLHSRGFQLDGTKKFKFFNFSRIFFIEKEIQGDIIRAKGNFRLVFSSPIDESVLTNFVAGLMELQDYLYLGSKEVGSRIKVQSVKILPYPRFENRTKYIMLSPTVVSLQNENKKVVYLNPTDDRVVDTLITNIVNKYKTIYCEKCPYEINIKFDENYLRSNLDAGNIMKLISVKVSQNKSAKIKGFMLPVEIQTDPIVHKLIYDSGLGEKNSLGFGMVEVVRPNQENRAFSKLLEK